MKNIILILSIFHFGNIYAQNEEDALRYSKRDIGGTARNMAMAGAITALGGDFSAVLQNPAAVGKFGKNNFSFTPYVGHDRVETNYLNQSKSTQKSSFKISNISFLKAYDLNAITNTDWVSLQLGAGYNRTQSFNQNTNYSGTGQTSIIDYFISKADGISSTEIYSILPFSSGLAYETFAIDPYLNPDQTTSYSTPIFGPVMQSRNIRSEGGMGEINFVMSANYKNRLLIGGSFNVVLLNYYTAFNHIETYNDPMSTLKKIDYSGYLDVSGRGLNARIGAIFTPTDFIRLGASIETPTRLSINEKFGNDLRTTLGSSVNSVTTPPTGAFDYVVRTPLKATGSIGFIFKKLGSISAEFELIDYSTMKMKSLRNSGVNFYAFNSENQQITNLYTTGYNIKLGAEARLTPSLYLRGGYATFGSPFKSEKNIYSPDDVFYTGGLGYNFGKYYLDFAAVVKQSKFNYVAYDPTFEGSTASVNSLRKQFVLTFGYRFQ